MANAKELLDRYNVEHNLNANHVTLAKVVDGMSDDEKKALAAELRRLGLMPPKDVQDAEGLIAREQPQTDGIPVLPLGHWDYLIKRYKPKQESADYPTRYLYDPITRQKKIVEKFPNEGCSHGTSVEV